MQQNATVAAVARNRTGCIKVAAAARKLNIHRATLGRYLKNYPELLDERGRVDFEQLVKHRGDNPQVVEAAERPKRQQPIIDPPEAGGRRSNKERLEEIKRWEAERDYAISLYQLVDPTRILDEISETAVALRDKFMTPDPVLCERVAGETDPRVVMSVIRDSNRALLDDFAARMKKIGEEAVKPPGGSAAPPDNAGP